MYEHTLSRKKLFILPTRLGLLFAFMLFALFGVAVKYGNQPAFLMTFLLGSLGHVSTLYTHRNLLGLKLKVGRAEPVFAGEAAEFPVAVENPGTTARSAIYLSPNAAADCFDLAPQQTFRTTLRVPAARRGYLHCPTVRLTSQYPIGLLFSWTRAEPHPRRCLVYPAPAPAGPLPCAYGGRGDLSGETGADGNTDFSGLRTFRPGDSLRHIHWRVMARQQEPVTKQFEGEAKGALWLRWSDADGNPEEKLSRLCRWVLDAENRQLDYGLEIPGSRIQPGRGRTHRHECLKALALWN